MRPLALLPLALTLVACATQPPAQYQPAPTASLAPDVAANLYAAQVAATQAQQATNAAQSATQAVSTATWQALELRQAEAQSTIDYQRAINDIAMTQQAISLTSQSISVSVQLTGIAVDRLKAQATATAQADALKYSIMLREESERVKGGATYGGLYGGLLALSSLVAMIAVGIFILQAGYVWLERKRTAPHIIPANMQVYAPAPVQAPALPPAQDTQEQPQKLSADTLAGLRFLSAALGYQEEHDDFARNKVPSRERMRKANYQQYATGSGWQNARNLFGALLDGSGDEEDGTITAEHDSVHSLYRDLQDGKITLPYPIPACS